MKSAARRTSQNTKGIKANWRGRQEGVGQAGSTPLMNRTALMSPRRLWADVSLEQNFIGYHGHLPYLVIKETMY